MRASITTGDASRPVEFTDVSPPTPAPIESIVAVGAFGLNCGKLMVSQQASSPGWVASSIR